MDVIRRMGEKRKETKEKFKQLQQDDKLNTMLEERKKSSNQRELEKYYKDQEEKSIKEALDKVHKQQTQDSWKGTTLSKQPNILRNERPILKEKNIFKNKTNMFLDNKSDIPFTSKGNNMFFN